MAFTSIPKALKTNKRIRAQNKSFFSNSIGRFQLGFEISAINHSIFLNKIMNQIPQQDTLFNYGELPNEDLQPLTYYNLEEDYCNDYCISPILPPVVQQPKYMNNTQHFSQAVAEDQNLITSILSAPAEYPTILQLPEALEYTSTIMESGAVKRSSPNPSTTDDLLEPLPKIQKTASTNPSTDENKAGPSQKKTKITRNRDKRNLKNKIDINGTFYKIAYRESLLQQLHITFEDILHAVKVKLSAMNGTAPSQDERKVVCDRIKHEVFLHDCINICRPSTRPYIHVHVNKTCEQCIKKNALRSKAAKV